MNNLMKISLGFTSFALLMAISMSGCMMMHGHGRGHSSTSDQHQSTDVGEDEDTKMGAGENIKDSDLGKQETNAQSHPSQTEPHKKRKSKTLYILGGIGMGLMMALMIL